jgi:hypothetical protein
MLGFDISVEIDNDADPDAVDTGSDREPYEPAPDAETLDDPTEDMLIVPRPPPPEWFEYWELEAVS